jgi:hypothetical protein
MRRFILFVLVSVALTGCLAAGCAGSFKAGPPQVHVQLNDGQLLVGELTTQTFSLKTQFGPLQFNAGDAGEIGPLEGSDMKQSGSLIKLWLKNGSEFVGDWQKPVVRMALSVGGQAVPIEVPIAKLQRLQFLGQPVFHEKPVFRVLTHSGDDFYVDAEKSRVRLTTEMGELNPFLAEIQGLTRRSQDENEWLVVLKTGTRIHAQMQPEGLDLKPALGPERILVAWTDIQRMEQAQIAQPALAQTISAPAAAESAAYYDNSMQMRAKQAEAQSWK